MASIYQLKSGFQGLLRPFTARLAAIGVTANQVTITALVVSVAAGLAVVCWPQARWPLWLIPPVLLVRMGLNAIDGLLAREHGMKTNLGCILNELGDVISDIGLYLPLALVHDVRADLVVAAVLLGVVTEMAGIVAVQIGAPRQYDGPMGKSDRAFAFSGVALLAASRTPPRWADLALAAIILLSIVTIANRCRRALRSAAPVPKD